MEQNPDQIITEYWDSLSIPSQGKSTAHEFREIDDHLRRLRMNIDSMSSSLDFLERTMVQEEVELGEDCKELYKGLKDRALLIRAEFNMSVYLLIVGQRIGQVNNCSSEQKQEVDKGLSYLHKKFKLMRDDLEALM